jgi:hypothetical protein
MRLDLHRWLQYIERPLADMQLVRGMSHAAGNEVTIDDERENSFPQDRPAPEGAIDVGLRN